MIHFYSARKIICYFIYHTINLYETSFRNNFFTLRKTKRVVLPQNLLHDNKKNDKYASIN